MALLEIIEISLDHFPRDSVGFGEFGTRWRHGDLKLFPAMVFAMMYFYFPNRKRLEEQRKAIRAALG